jgi:hypothetical protein
MPDFLSALAGMPPVALTVLCAGAFALASFLMARAASFLTAPARSGAGTEAVYAISGTAEKIAYSREALDHFLATLSESGATIAPSSSNPGSEDARHQMMVLHASLHNVGGLLTGVRTQLERQTDEQARALRRARVYATGGLAMGTAGFAMGAIALASALLVFS